MMPHVIGLIIITSLVWQLIRQNFFFLFFNSIIILQLDSIANKKNAHIQRGSGHEFSIAHYTGKITYDAREMADKNRDFIPPEMVK